MARKAKRKLRRVGRRQVASRPPINWERVVRVVRVGGGLAFVVCIAAATLLGLFGLDAHVKQTLARGVTPTVSFTNLPPDLAELMQHDLQSALSDLIERDWTDDRLCRDMAGRLSQVGWVAEVNYVRRLANGRFEVNCRYRRPFALTRSGMEFFLVDGDGIRLPGVYRYDPSWPLIQGVSGAAPDPGKPWFGEDLQAGLGIIGAVARKPFASQITAVLVDNFVGRVDRARTHIELATDRAGGRIRWGSAPGHELEENTVEQKLAILDANYRRTGRVDADHAVIDISTRPDRFTVPG